MEISRMIKGTPALFFDLLMNALVADVQASCHRVCDKEEIQAGFHYQKVLKNKMGKSGKVRVDITSLQEPFVYEAAFSSAQGKNTLSYCAEVVDDEHINVVYREDFTSSSLSKRLNYAIMSKLYKRSSAKRANLVLDQLQQCMEKGC